MAKGVYRHLKAPLATCGCDLEVQTFLAASTQHIGASSIVALAVKIGDATLVFEATLRPPQLRRCLLAFELRLRGHAPSLWGPWLRAPGRAAGLYCAVRR